MKQFDRAYVKVHLDHIADNMEAMRKKLAPGTKMIGVVKTDAYGHGAVAVAKTIDRFAAGYAVAEAEEAFELRRGGITKPILILGPAPESQYEDIIKQEICQAVFDLRRAERLSDKAAVLGKKAKIHIAVDTGMSRIGYLPSGQAAEEIRQISHLPGIEIEGMFTHFARADETDKGPAYRQLEKFCEFAARVRALGVEIPICHCSNSAGIVEMKEANLDAVRAGITMYGLYPSDEVDRKAIILKPAMELKSFITYIKEIGPETEISYGGTFKSEAAMKIATVSIGYGDGYPRSLSGRGQVIVKGRRVPILGRVCMDQLMIDVTGLDDIREGDEVTLLGRDGQEEITMEELAELSGGFHYEIPCLISKRVPRLYVSGESIVGAMTWTGGNYQEL